MAEAGVVLADAPRKPLVKRLLVPLVMLLVGAGAGATGMMFAPQLLSDATVKKPPQPKVAPLQYVEIDNSFTANLKDTGRFVQVKIAVSTQGGQPVVDAVERHNIAIVAAVLNVLADSSEQMLSAAGGRAELTQQMRIAINDVLQRKAGITGVDDVFLTSFVMQ